VLSNQVGFGILIPFLLLWGLVLLPYLTSRWSGWSTLADFFRSDTDFRGQKWRMQSAAMRYAMSYNNCLTIGANEEGLYLAMPMFFIRVGHPPLFIPWSEVSASPVTTGWLRGRTRLHLGRDLQIPLTISAALAQKLQMTAGTQWPLASSR